MPYANNNGVKIYYEVEGQGPPLVLAHGGGGSLGDWRKFGFTAPLKRDFELVLFDARGHGQSDKPHGQTDYGLQMASDVVTVLDNLGMSRACYFGYSMAARTGFWLATRHAERFTCFILGGTAPKYPETEAEIKAETNITESSLKVFRLSPQDRLSEREKQLGRKLTLEEKEMLLFSDMEARIAIRTSRAVYPRLTNRDLSLISAPCLLYAGDLDAMFYAGCKEAAGLIPRATFFSLAGFDHAAAYKQSDLVLPYVRKFLAEVGAKL